MKTEPVRHWPCPHKCWNWARATNPREPQTNHHPRCEFVDESLIDVWRVSIPGDGAGCIHDNEADAKEMVKHESVDAPLEIVAGKMHREIFEQLNEFGGF